MNKGYYLSILLISCISLGIIWHSSDWSFEYPYFSTNEMTNEGEDETTAQRTSMQEARIQYEFDLLKDPKTGKIPIAIYRDEMKQAMSLPVSLEPQILRNGVVRIPNGVTTPTSNLYQKAGPNNIGGRTRTLVFDKRYNGTTNRVIISGCVSGGLMRSNDGGANWDLVTPSQQIHSLTTLAQDPRPGFQDTWYAGTGEAQGNSAGASSTATFFGNGLFKSIDNGITWNALTSTQTGSLLSFDNSFDFIHKMVVHPVTGDIYVACNSTLQRSQNGGITWSIIKGANTGNSRTGNTDIVITNTGSKIYLSFHLSNTTNRGVWESTTGDAGSFVAIAGNIANTPTGFKQNTGSTWGRVLLALAPSNNNVLYVLYENGESQASPSFKPEVDLFKMEIIAGINTWTDLSLNMPNMPDNNKASSDPISVQGAYDMLLSVKPDDPNSIYIGGTNLYRSINGFTNNDSTSWIGGYATNFTYSLYPNSHADMHGLVFDPTNNNRAFSLNDGGIQVTEDIKAATVVWVPLKNYQTLQFYHVTIDPEVSKDNFMGGAQDNSTFYRDATLNLGTRPTSRPNINDYANLYSGDGVSVGISTIALGKQYFYMGSQSGDIARRDLTLAVPSLSFKSIKPPVSELTSDGNGGFGSFITNFKLSNANTEILFYVNYNKLFLTNTASTVDSSKWVRLSNVEDSINIAGGTSVSIRGMSTSWGPYLNTHALYFGTSNGKLFRLDNYANADASTKPINITPPGLSGNVIDIAVNPNDDNEVMAVVSNYNVNSIWWTWNAKSATPSWSNVEGNLTLPSIRSCVILVKKEGGLPVTEYYVGTSVGLYTTASIGKTMGSAGSVVWSREAASLLNFVVVTSMDYRPEDNTLLIGTHGNGMYFSSIGSPNFTPNVPTAIASPIVNDKNFVRVYPTISNGNYHFEQGNVTGIKKLQIQVYNMAGQAVYQSLINYGSGNIPLTNLPNGTYIVQITSDNKKYQTLQKVFKQ